MDMKGYFKNRLNRGADIVLVDETEDGLHVLAEDGRIFNNSNVERAISEGVVEATDEGFKILKPLNDYTWINKETGVTAINYSARKDQGVGNWKGK